MMSTFLQEFYSKSGITRDGTAFDAKTYSDGLWVRFFKDRPKKIGGYQMILPGIVNDITSPLVRTLFTYTAENQHSDTELVLVLGRGDNLSYSIVDMTGQETYEASPETAFYFTDQGTWNPDEDNLWSLDLVSYGGKDIIVAMPIPTSKSLYNDKKASLFYSDDQTNLKVAKNSGPPFDNLVEATGGCCVIGSYVFVFGNNGVIRYNDGEKITGTAPDDPAWPVGYQLSVGSEVFIFGAPVRSGQQISGLFWSTTGLIRVFYKQTFDLAGDPVSLFDYVYVSTLSSCLSAKSIVSYEPFFFWVGADTFYQYNGTVSEIPNQTNKLFFFEHLNKEYAARVTSFVNTEYYEWWILFPKDESEECNHAIVYNMLYKEWYDTPLSRSTAARSTDNTYRPILASSKKEPTSDTFPIWVHEVGTDKVLLEEYGEPEPIESSITFQTSLLLQQQPNLNNLVLDTILLDINQTEEMSVSIQKQGYPRSPAQSSDLIFFSPSTEFLTLSEKGMILQITFKSHILGGNYFFGKTLLKFSVSDDLRPEPASALPYPDPSS